MTTTTDTSNCVYSNTTLSDLSDEELEAANQKISAEIASRERARTELKIGDYVKWNMPMGWIPLIFKTHSWKVADIVTVDGVKFVILDWYSRRQDSKQYKQAIVPIKLVTRSGFRLL